MSKTSKTLCQLLDKCDERTAEWAGATPPYSLYGRAAQCIRDLEAENERLWSFVKSSLPDEVWQALEEK